MKKIKQFSPLSFLASLGAGGISIIPFAILQYTHPHEGGLVQLSDISHGSLSLWENLYFLSLEAVMVVFILLHFILTIILFKKLIPFLRSKNYSKLMKNPLKSSAILAPFISITMTLNVFIGPLRFFVSPMADNLQSFMMPAMITWTLLFILLLKTEIKLLKTSFETKFDTEKINFGWLLHAFALSMITVTGTGIAAMAKSPNIAHTAAFLSLVSGSMGVFLLMIKTTSLFQKHFKADNGLGDKEFLPAFLIVIPNVTLYSISAFRIGHYLEHQHNAHLGSYFLLVTVLAFAFEVWYMIFGLSLLKDYIKKHHFKKEFYISQWGLVCPFVAFAVLSSFLYTTFVASPIFILISIISMIVSIFIFFDLLIRNMKCNKVISGKINCLN